MAEQFQDQGGAATMDPSPLLRWLTSKLSRRLFNPQRLQKQRTKFEKARQRAGERHVVEYFHQVEDGYSHLAAQVLLHLAQRYDIDLVCHLVRGPEGKNSAEPELLLQLSRYDSQHVAPEYGLQFPGHTQPVEASMVEMATAVLAAQDNEGFIESAAHVGEGEAHVLRGAGEYDHALAPRGAHAGDLVEAISGLLQAVSKQMRSPGAVETA